MLKNLKLDDSVSLGRRLLNHALSGRRKLVEIQPENIQLKVDRMKLATLEDLLAEIGLGNVMSVVITKSAIGGDRLNLTPPVGPRTLPIKGADGVLITFAKCCLPIPQAIRSSLTSALAKGWWYTMNLAAISGATRKSSRNLCRWSSNGNRTGVYRRNQGRYVQQ